MLLKIVSIIFIINTFSFYAECNGKITKSNETEYIAQLTKLRKEIMHELERCKKKLYGRECDESATKPCIYPDLNETSAFVDELTKLREDVSLKLDQCKDKLYGRDCAESTTDSRPSGIYKILIPSFSSEPFKVACDANTEGGRWTIILRRLDGSVVFYRGWSSYKKGFGDLDGEFFIGLEKLHALSTDKVQELLVILEDYDGNTRQQKYDKFAIGDESEEYVLQTLGKSFGTAGDSLSVHHGMKFTTFDRKNDQNDENCAQISTGAWWYKNCHDSNLAGKYGDDSLGKGINWFHFKGFSYSLKRAVMMIRPR